MAEYTIRSYGYDDAPGVQVRWDGQWRQGTLHEWRKSPEGRWIGTVRFNVGPSENRIAGFDQDDIREDPGF